MPIKPSNKSSYPSLVRYGTRCLGICFVAVTLAGWLGMYFDWGRPNPLAEPPTYWGMALGSLFLAVIIALFGVGRLYIGRRLYEFSPRRRNLWVILGTSLAIDVFSLIIFMRTIAIPETDGGFALFVPVIFSIWWLMTALPYGFLLVILKRRSM